MAVSITGYENAIIAKSREILLDAYCVALENESSSLSRIRIAQQCQPKTVKFSCVRQLDSG